MPGPAPIISFAAESADPDGGRVDQTHIPNLYLGDLEIPQSAEK